MITDRFAESEPDLDKKSYRQTLKTYMYLWRSNTGDGLNKTLDSSVLQVLVNVKNRLRFSQGL